MSRVTSGPWRLVREHLPCDLDPFEVLRTSRSDRHPVALTGSWLGGGAVVASEPVVVRSSDGDGDPFALLDRTPRAEGGTEGVHGGWIGYMGYRAGHLVERLPAGPRRPRPLPDWWLAFHDHVLRLDPGTGWWFEALWTDERAAVLESRHAELAARLAAPPPPPEPFACSPFVPTPEPEVHRKAVQRTIELIEAGDIYQANVCLRLDATVRGSCLDLFVEGASRTAPPYGAFLDLGDGRAIASLSPERFLRREGDRISTAPIKGTRRRRTDPHADAESRDELMESGKERAENVMIVDLMRNDLGRVCVPGSIQVPRLFRIEAHPGVWHLVSEVAGRLRDGTGDGGLLRATLPPGSVTGAPKVRAMEVIAEVESTGREVYTGAIGVVSPTAGADWSVCIRTFEAVGADIWLGAGGGIVAESDPAAELAECHAKARPLLDAIGARLAGERTTR